jgi:coenzyme F420-reducing hydrogenase beta subunit
MSVSKKRKEDCCGCYACLTVCPVHCITMREDSEGFAYPVVDSEKCIDCGLCEEVCPFIHPFPQIVSPNAFAAKHINSEIRISSSSGGVFTALAKHVIDSGGAVFGARWDSNWTVEHDFTEKIEGLAAFRGSKYLQSRIGDTYNQAEKFLKTGRRVLFSGSPCQIAGLKRFLRKEYNNLLTVDFVCHGVPSPKVFLAYLKYLISANNLTATRINDIKFRDKLTPYSWRKPGFSILEISDVQSKRLYSEPFFNLSLYGRGFLLNLYLRPSCHGCAVKGLKSGSDITLGDFWAADKNNNGRNNNDGTSIVFINSPKGKKIYTVVTPNLMQASLDYESLNALCPVLMRSERAHTKREEFFKIFKTGEESVAITRWRYIVS